MRAFLALELPEELKYELAQIMKRLQADKIYGAKWVESQQLHVTVQFIGEVTDEQINLILEYINSKIVDLSSFKIENLKLEFIPQSEQARLMWIGCLMGQNNLHKFIKEFQVFLHDKNIMVDTKPFRFHITLSRFKEMLPEVFIDRAIRMQLPSNSWKIRRMSLYESKLYPSGPQYRNIKSFQLQEEN